MPKFTPSEEEAVKRAESILKDAPSTHITLQDGVAHIMPFEHQIQVCLPNGLRVVGFVNFVMVIDDNKEA